ncbi:hypothetical protein BDP67DRAFT_172966 [Colletotrichum lupini]|nr:hypothetical protein BDP67DRAFT_172966 [Colletotrichum lupini]
MPLSDLPSELPHLLEEQRPPPPAQPPLPPSCIGYWRKRPSRTTSEPNRQSSTTSRSETDPTISGSSFNSLAPLAARPEKALSHQTSVYSVSTTTLGDSQAFPTLEDCEENTAHTHISKNSSSTSPALEVSDFNSAHLLRNWSTDERNGHHASKDAGLVLSPDLEKSPAQVDFEENPAHFFWTWSFTEQNWYHVSEDTALVLWAPLELD